MAGTAKGGGLLLPWFAAAWLAGLAGASELQFPSWQWFTLSAAAVVAACGVRRDRAPGHVFLALAFLFLGAARAQIAAEIRASATVAGYIGQVTSVDLNGVVSSGTETWGEANRFDLRPRWISNSGGSSSGAIDRGVRGIPGPGASVRRGTTVVAGGRLRHPAGQERTGHS